MTQMVGLSSHTCFPVINFVLKRRNTFISTFIFKGHRFHFRLQWRIQGFPEGAPISKVSDANLFFCRKLHKNERIWTRPWRPPGPPMVWWQNLKLYSFKKASVKQHNNIAFPF